MAALPRGRDGAAADSLYLRTLVCLHTALPAPGGRIRDVGLTVLFLALPLAASNIWSKILLSREPKLTLGEQLAWN